MEIILLERIEKLGQMGDQVKVKDGYARNFLLPRKKALRATDENKLRFESERAQLETHSLERKKDAEAISEKLEGTKYVILRQASDMGQLYGSVSSRDIAEALTEAGFTAEKRQINLSAPIKALGVHEVRVVLHPEVLVSVSVNVARSEEEAEAQSVSEAEGEVPAAAEFFETEEAAREAVEALTETENDGAESDAAPAAETSSESTDEENSA